MALLSRSERLAKELGLFDVFAISAGAMFSSGFFLLPGLASAKTGPSVVLAYLVAALLVVPAMLSKAELSTAMPRAGGTYYFLDRSLGPMVGTVGGLGTWAALVLKSAFALIGMGAYLSLFVGLPITPVALALTLLFGALNVVGVKETTSLQRALVIAMLAVLALFIGSGFWEVAGGARRDLGARFDPFFAFGADGFFATVGFVFISFVGLTKVASVPEEVEDPERNVPLGMMLSLGAATVVYVVGIAVMVAVLEPGELHSALTPVASAASKIFGWLPGRAGVVIVSVAALAGFSAMANAGLMSASRYPLAMARDRLVWPGLARVGRFGTPTVSVIVTTLVMMAVLAVLDVEKVAKLASTVQLLIFALVNVAVVVMRESGIDPYDPGFRSPLYPWTQVVGFVAPVWLVLQMGALAALFALGVLVTGIAWYRLYGRARVDRHGALYHVFARLGRRRHEGLEAELRQILKEKGVREADLFDEVVTRARVLDLAAGVDFDDLVSRAAGLLAADVPADAGRLELGFREGTRTGRTPVSHGAALPHLRIPGITDPRLLLVRSSDGIVMRDTGSVGRQQVHAVFFLVSPDEHPRRHLRLLAQIAEHVDTDGFLERWLNAENEQELKEILLRDEHFLRLELDVDGPTSELVGQELGESPLPAGAIIALIHRGGEVLVPRGDTLLRAGDQITVLAEPEVTELLYRRYRDV